MTAILVHTDRPAAVATRWYRVVLGGYEPIAHDDGTVTQEFVIDGVNVEVAATYLGLGTRDAIEAAAAGLGKEVIDFWPITRPIAA
jgi:hypothetical protein